MLSEFLFYLLGIVAMVGAILLLERIVAGPHSTNAAFAVTRPRRMTLNEILLRPTSQPG